MSLVINIPLTRIKIGLAKILYLVTKIFIRKDIHIINRGNIRYEINLKEGLDLSLFLFGNFQSHVSNNKYLNISTDGVIFDVGANVGIMTLQFSRMVPYGNVYAFEPTHYALGKLKRNLELNPQLSKTVTVIQSFVTSPEKLNKEIKAYSSWRVDGEKPKNRHPVHRGTAMPTEGVKSITIDQFCETMKIERIDFIKIDTDGHEPDVLNGALKSIRKWQPKIIFEVGQYVMEEHGIDFSFYLKLFSTFGYNLANSTNLKTINMENWSYMIPKKGTIDILAYV